MVVKGTDSVNSPALLYKLDLAKQVDTLLKKKNKTIHRKSLVQKLPASALIHDAVYEEDGKLLLQIPDTCLIILSE